ncbi:glycosyltransferase family 87 protein [Streptomyces sp. NPDC058655]|uniref:glycosyltransferase family 87 protein n=1 Tax=unclassified Streptomyces TaxID=2593676 RepID=UPI00365D0845
MTRPAPHRSPSPLVGGVVTGSLLVLGVLCVALRLPMADALLRGFSAAEWRPPAAYPPFAAILLTPAAWLPAGVLKAVVVLGTAGLFALLVLLSCRLAGLRPRRGPVLAATIGGLWLETLFQDPLPGQVDLALACLVLWDLGRPGAALGKGFALGIAAGSTLAPAVFIPYLLLTHRVRDGLTALAALAGTALMGLLVLPEASEEFWTRHLPAAGRTLLPGWPQLWIWCVPVLAVLIAAVRAPAAGAPAPGGPAPGAPAPGAPVSVPAPGTPAGVRREGRVSRSSGARRRP